MKNTILSKFTLTLFFILILIPKNETSIPSWPMINSSVEVTGGKIYTSKAYFNSEAVSTYKASDGNYYIEIGSKSIQITFPAITSFVKYGNYYYICPDGETAPHLWRYNSGSTSNVIEDLSVPKIVKDNHSTWGTKCYYRSKAQSNQKANSIIVLFSKTKYLHWYQTYSNKWADNKVKDIYEYFTDFLMDEESEVSYEGSNPFYYSYYVFMNTNVFRLTMGRLTLNQGENTEPVWNDVRGDVQLANGADLGNTKIMIKKRSSFDFDVYIMTYGDSGYNLYHATTSNIQSNGVTQQPKITLPFDFGESYTILDYNFINKSNYYYYRVRTASGKIYWGMGELINNRIVFNSLDTIDTISPYQDSQRGVLVSTSTKSYFVCPYSLSSYTCNACASGQTLLLNPADKNVCTSDTSNMDITNGIAECSDGYIVDGTSCVNCASKGGYTTVPDGTCETDCDTSIAVKDVTNKQCTFCYKLSTPQYLYNGACTSTKPAKTYLSNESKMVLSDCDSSCSSCEETSTKCTSCSGTLYLQPSSNQCLATCPGFYGKYTTTDTNENQCVNCNEKSLVRYKDGDTCISTPSNGIFTVPTSETDNINYGIIDSCHSNCETCTSKGDDTTDNKCTLCNSGLFLEGTLCLSNCTTGKLYADSISRTCVKCTTGYKYLGQDEPCQDPQPDGTFVVDSDYHIIENCYSTCSTCSAVSTDSNDQKCLTCKENFYLLNGNCISECEDTFYQDISLRECVNCKTKYGKVKYIGKTLGCIDTPTDKAVYSTNDTNGIIADCGTSCLSCQGGPSSGNDGNCYTCESGKYLSYDIQACISECGSGYNYAISGDSCVKCSDSSINKYKYLDGDTCIDRPTNDIQPTYVYDTTFNIIKNCHQNCASCEGEGSDSNNNCTLCKSQFTQLDKHCLSACSDSEQGLYNGQCINCSNEGKVKYLSDVECREKPTTPFYYVNQGKGIIADCDSSCKSCVDEATKCLSCYNGKYLAYKGNSCLDNCDTTFLIEDSKNNECVNCKDLAATPYRYANLAKCIADPQVPFAIVDTDYNIIELCYSSCKTCNGKEITNADNSISHNCIECKDGFYLQPETGSTNCESTCPEYYATNSTTNKCINCASVDKFKYASDTTCTLDSKPDNTYYVVESFHIIADCDISCNECNGPASVDDTNCKACANGYFFQPGSSSNCKQTCPNYYAKQDSNSSCVNCKVLGEYKYPTQDYCTGSTTQPLGYYVDIEEFNLLAPCYDSCETCQTGGDETNHNCDTCIANKVLGENNKMCKDTCENEFLYADILNRVCVKCDSTKVKYKGENQQCFEWTSNNAYYFINEDYRVIADCGTSCKTCLESPLDGKTDGNCDTCEDGYYLSYGPKACVSDCGANYLYALSNDDKSCVKCSENSDGNTVKYFDGVYCIQRPLETDQPTYFYESDYGVIKKCHNNCASCNTGPSDDGTIHNCVTCKDGYTLNGTNCIACTDNREGILNGVCVNCKLNSKIKYESNVNCQEIPSTPYYFIDEDYGIIADCHPNCASCEEGPNSDGSIHNCKTCSGSFYLLDKNCVTDCTQNYAKYATNNTCVNCALFEPPQYNLNQQCQTYRIGYYITDTTYNTIAACNSPCYECDNTPTTCTACDGIYYLASNETKCITSCHIYEVTETNRCINCKNLTPSQFKYDTQNYCVDRPENSVQPTFIVDEDYNLIENCDSSCKACEVTATNCTSCPDNTFKQPDSTECKDTCPDNYGDNLIDQRCDKCPQTSKPYIIQGTHECIAEPTQPYKVILGEFGVIELCYSSCQTCNGKEITNADNSISHNCIECKDGFYLQPETGSTNCESTCPEYYVKDDEHHKCINCSTEGKFRYESNTTCVYTTQPPNTYIVDNNQFNIIADCDISCNECNGPASVDDTNCKACAAGYFFQPGSSSNCKQTCPTKYAKQDSSHSCINCKTIPEYKYPNEEYCTGSYTLPEGTFNEDPDFNILGFCFSTCSTCDSQGTSSTNLCNSCKSSFVEETQTPPFNCVTPCNPPYKWYLNSNGIKVCLNGANCPSTHSLLVESEYQCVESCLPTGTCQLCKTKELYADNQKCIENCPAGKKPNTSKHTCESTAVNEENGCTTSLVKKTSTNVSSNSVNTLFSSEIKTYIEENANSIQNVRVIQTSQASYYIYKNDTCGYDISMKYNMTYSDLSNCIDKLIEVGSISSNDDIIIGQLDVTRQTETTNQAGYYIAKSDGTKINLEPCDSVKIPVTYPISENDIIRLARSDKFSAMGIDLNNPQDSFFNDFCFPFYDENGRDVTLEDRRKYFFENNTLCEEGCDYTSINFKTARVECSCEVKQSTFDKITENIPFDDFPSGLSMNNLIVVRCYNLVFNWKYMQNNYGCWIIVGLFALQLITAINFFIMGLGPLYSFLNQFHRDNLQINQSEKSYNEDNSLDTPSNPPRKKRKDSYEEEEEEEEEDSESESTPRKGKSKRTIKTHNNRQLSNQHLVNRTVQSTDIFESPDALKGGHGPNKGKLPMFDLDKKPHGKVGLRKKMGNNYLDSEAPSPVVYTKEKFNSTAKINDTEKQESPEFDDEELDDLAYEDALEFDHRSFFRVYCLILKNNLLLISVFANISVFEPFCIKLIAFFLNLAAFFVFNAMFFDEEYISNRYQEDGTTGFLYMVENEIPKCIYASLASMLVSILINYLSNSRKRFDTLMKKEKDEKTFLAESKKIIKSMKGKLFTFFIVTIILMSFFWYYVSAFCAVYQKTQTAWIEGTIITFIFSIVLYSFLYLLVAMMRFIGLKCHVSCFYTLSGYFM